MIYKRSISFIGAHAVACYSTCKNFILFFAAACKIACTTRWDYAMLMQQIERIGIGSLSIVILTGTFTGMVFALQSYIGFARLGGQQFIGTVVALGMARELGPVLTGLMVTGRSCSAIAAEIGTMRITEQLDALWTLRINIFSYLIVPRIIASILMLPCLTLFAVFCGVLGGGVLVTYALNQSATAYVASIVQYAQIGDLISGLIKSVFFGLILSVVGCYKGYYTHDGARGVGRATTQAVVLGSMLILISNYFLTKLLDGL